MHRLSFVVIIAAAFAGCSATEAAPQVDFRVDTVGSIPVTTNLAEKTFPAPEAVQPKEVFRVGSESGEAETLFSGPLIAVNHGPHGNLYVLDWRSAVVRVFGEDGRFVREFAGAGRGPGELSAPAALAWDSLGRLWISEPFERRYSVFDSGGAFLKTVPRPAFRGVNRRIYPAAFESEGSLLDHGSLAEGLGMFRADTTGAVLDTFPPVSYPPNPLSGTVVAGRDPEWVNAVRKLQPRLIWTLAPDGTLWIARTDSLRLVHRTLEGDTLRVIETAHRPAAFTESERPIIDRVSRQYEQVEFTPAVIQSLHASDDGLLYVQIAGELGEPGREIDVFGEEGEYLGSFELELPIQPLSQSHFSGGRFSYVGIGALDVPVVIQTRVGG